jgi:hypothetical protein
VKLAAEQPFTALVGVDWSDKKHDFCLLGAGSQQRELGMVAHRPETIDQWARALYQRFGGPIAVCLEIAKGPLVHALQRYEFMVLFPVNPATLAKYREAFVPSRAKETPAMPRSRSSCWYATATGCRRSNRKVRQCEP